MLIDSHCHIYLEEFRNDLPQVIKNAKKSGIVNLLLPNIDSSSIEDMLAVEKKYPDYCRAMIGLHPCSVKENYEDELRIVEDWLANRRFVAIGEIGTDLFWDKTYWPQQQIAFNRQCELALQYNLPIVIHSRDSIDETIDLIKPHIDKGLQGVFHCFTGSVDQALQIKKFGFYLGIGGVVTFKNGGIKEVIEKIGLDKVMLETDSPYLAPVPHRGKRNEPAYTSLVCEKIALALNMDFEKVSNITSKNATVLFKV
jgi:TatD DNase family protein